jgi:hypothetical protein
MRPSDASQPRTPAATRTTPAAHSPDGGGQPPSGRTEGAATELRHSLRRLLEPQYRRDARRVLIVALLSGATCFYFGANPWYSVLVTMVIAAVGVLGSVALAGLEADDITWSDDDDVVDLGGGRNDVLTLSWLVRGSYGLVDRGAIRRVQALARRRLARHGLDLLDPSNRHQVEQLIGSRAYSVIVPGNRRRRLRSLLHCLDVLDSLDPTNHPVPSRL